MRRFNKISQWFILSILLASLIACASFDRNTYRVLSSAGSMGNIAIKGLDELYAQKKITKDQYTDNMKLAKAFSTAYHKSVDAFEIWKKSNTTQDKDKVIVAMTEAMAYMATLSYSDIVGMIKDFKEAYNVFKTDYDKIKK